MDKAFAEITKDGDLMLDDDFMMNILKHWRRKLCPSKSTCLTYLRNNRSVQLDCRQKKTHYTHMDCYMLNYTSPRESKFFSLTYFLLWITPKHFQSFELNSETRGRLHQSMYLKLREWRARRRYQRRRGFHLRVLIQAIESPRVCMHHPLWVSKSEVSFILIIVQPR